MISVFHRFMADDIFTELKRYTVIVSSSGLTTQCVVINRLQSHSDEILFIVSGYFSTKRIKTIA